MGYLICLALIDSFLGNSSNLTSEGKLAYHGMSRFSRVYIYRYLCNLQEQGRALILVRVHKYNTYVDRWCSNLSPQGHLACLSPNTFLILQELPWNIMRRVYSWRIWCIHNKIAIANILVLSLKSIYKTITNRRRKNL